MKLSWQLFKSEVNNRNLSIQYSQSDEFYFLKAFNLSVCMDLNCELSKNPTDTSDLDDFEANYKNNANKPLMAVDSDGSLLQRTKITTAGWHYQLHGIEFETSKLDSVYSKKQDNTNYGFSSMKFYKLDAGNEVEITGDDLNQTYLNTNCIKTVLDWEPTHDLEIVGGLLKMVAIPTEDLRMWTVGVPDISEQYGGSKPFAININLKYIGLEDGVKVDGRAPKFLSYNATYHTNKLQMILRHSAGFNHKLHMIFELFKL